MSLTLIQSFIQHLGANENVAFHIMEPLPFNEILIFRGIQKLTISVPQNDFWFIKISIKEKVFVLLFPIRELLFYSGHFVISKEKDHTYLQP